MERGPVISAPSITELYFHNVTPKEDPLAQFRTTDSFNDVAKAFGQLSSDDPLELLIRGHLWIESALATLISRSMSRPAVLDKAGLSFSQKVSLAEAMGLIRQDVAFAMRQINRLRNRSAHNLNDPPNAADQAQFLGSCSDYIRHVSGTDVEDFEFPEGVSQVIATLVIITHGRIDEIDANHRYSAHLHERVEALRRRVSAKAPPGASLARGRQQSRLRSSNPQNEPGPWAKSGA